MCQQLADDSADDGERASRLVGLSNRFGGLGRREEALATIEQAVTIRRQLAEARPDAFLPHLAMLLRNLADALSMLNRDAEASTIRDEAAAGEPAG